jgi:hypothetical protein
MNRSLIPLLLIGLSLPLFTRAQDAPEEKKPAVEEKKAQAFVDEGFGEFGSNEPIPRKDEPERGVMHFPVTTATMQQGQHWEFYTIPFKAKRWGKYQVRATYTMTAAALGVQVIYGKGTPNEAMLKKQMMSTAGAKRTTTFGEIYIPAAGDQFISVFTPQGVGFTTFTLHEITLVPSKEGGEVKPTEDGSFELLAKHATTWSENMRYEPKAEKNCLGYWTDAGDFAEWEIKVEKPGKYKINVHQGSATGGSEIAVHLADKELKFTVKNTGDFHKFAEVTAGEVEIKEAGTYRLAVKPQKKNGGAIMDVQKVVLVPVG